MRVEIDPGEVAQQTEAVTKEFQKLARIPGFRPGHAPRSLIEKRFAREIQDDVQRKTIPESYRTAISEHKLRVVTMPEIDKVEFAKDKPLSYEARLEVAPEFTLPPYKGLPVKKKSAEVTDEDLDKTLDMLREQKAEFTDVTARPLAMDDFAIIRYSAVCEGKPLKEVAPNAQLPAEDKDFWFWMGEGSFAPGFPDQLVGANVGDRKQVLIDFPADHPQKELAGRKATFFVEIKGVKEKKLPALDDAFAKSIQADDLATLKAKLREDLAGQKRSEASADAKRQIMDQLLKVVQFELPPQMLAEETRGVVYDMVRDSMMRGATKEMIDAKKDEIFGFASKGAEERVRVAFILARIAEEEKITVEPKEIEERIQALAARYQTPVTKLREKLNERGGTFEIEEQIQRAKTLDFLEANAKLEPA